MFEYYREAEEVSIWISDMGVIAASEDYGQDLEHVEVGIVTIKVFIKSSKYYFLNRITFFFFFFLAFDFCCFCLNGDWTRDLAHSKPITD